MISYISTSRVSLILDDLTKLTCRIRKDWEFGGVSWIKEFMVGRERDWSDGRTWYVHPWSILIDLIFTEALTQLKCLYGRSTNYSMYIWLVGSFSKTVSQKSPASRLWRCSIRSTWTIISWKKSRIFLIWSIWRLCNSHITIWELLKASRTSRLFRVWPSWISRIMELKILPSSTFLSSYRIWYVSLFSFAKSDKH